MTNGQRRAVNAAGLGAAGAVGAFLMVYDPFWQSMRFTRGSFNPLGGIWLGGGFAAFFWLTGRDRSVWRPLALIAASAGAFWLAVFAAAAMQMTTMMVPGLERQTLWALVAGGIVGGLLLSTATFLLYAKDRSGVGERIAACTVGGGLAGLLAFMVVGDIARTLDDAPFAPIFMVWQPAMGLLLGVLWPPTDIDD